jgi:hypothetical protein
LLCVYFAEGFFGSVFGRPAPIAVVDVMVLYTAQARAGAGSPIAIQTAIDLAMLEANRVFQNSHINARLRLVYKGEINYIESGSVANDLARLRTPGDGYLEEAQALRDAYAADLVCLITETGPDYLFYGLQGPSSANAFSILRRPYLTGYNYLPVVLSFNFGCQLDAGHADSVGAFPYSYGYTFSANGTDFGTVDAPASPNRVAWFSNPDLEFQGMPTGIPAGSPGAANNTKTINNTARIVAGFRGTNNSGRPPEVQILTPAKPLPGAGQNLTLIGSASDSDGFVTEVRFLLNGQFVGASTNASFSFMLTNLPYGSNFVTAVAVDNSGLTSPVASLVLNIVYSFAASDNFADRVPLTGRSIHFPGDSASATREPDEPAHDVFYPNLGSVWWKWIAPESGTLFLTNANYPAWLNGANSPAVKFFALYSGEALSNLVSIPSSVTPFGLAFDVSANETYALVYVGIPGPFDASLSLSTVSLTSPVANIGTTDPQRFVYPTNIPLAASVSQVEMPIRWVDFLAKDESDPAKPDQLLASVSMPPYAASWTNAPQGYYSVYAQAVLENGETMPSRPGNIAVAPSNDQFANALLVTATNFVLNVLYPGSVWWKWIPPGNGRAALTIASLRYPIPLVSVYTGTNAAQLHRVAANDYFGPHSSNLVFSAHADRPYYIQIASDGTGPSETAVLSSFEAAPSNDDFAHALAIASDNLTIQGDTATATSEDGEPQFYQSYGDTLWWRWTPLHSGTAEINRTNDPSQSIVSIFSGDALTKLTNLVDIPPTSIDNFPVTAGQSYLIQVSESVQPHAQPFEFQLRYVPPPSNDKFASAIEIAGEDLFLAGDNRAASRESGELDLSAFGVGFCLGKTIWWSWTAPVSGLVFLSTESSDFLPVAGIFAGNAVDSLTNIATFNLNIYSGLSGSFVATAGTIYKIAVDGRAFYAGPAGGAVRMRLRSFPPPANDDFANRILLNGVFATNNGNNYFASIEQREPFTGVFIPSHSVWYSWTAPATSMARLHVDGFSYANVGVYTGEQLPNLAPVSVERINYGHDTSFNAVEGVTYQISLDSDSSVRDRFAFTLQFDKIFITSPTNGGYFILPSPISIQARTIDSDGAITSVKFLADNGVLGTTTNRPFTFVWTNAPLGNHILSLEALDEFGRTNLSARVSISVIRPEDDPTPPANDNFANRSLLTGPYYHIRTSNQHASAEPTEPAHDSQEPYHSLWWSWTASASGDAELRAIFPANGGSSPSIAVYTGNSLSALKRIASGVNQVSSGTHLSFTVISNTTYQIAIDSPSPNQIGPLEFELNAPRLNDDFANRIAISGSQVLAVGSTAGATRQMGEPIHAGVSNALGETIWWSWIAPANGSATISVAGNGSVGSAPIVAVYTGDNLSELTPVAGATGDTDRPASLSFRALAGVPYVIAIDLRPPPTADFGVFGFGSGIVLRVALNTPPKVTLISPTNGAAVLQNTHFLIEASANDADGVIAHADVFNGNTLLGSLTNPPFTFTITNLATGPATLRVAATDDLGGVGLSQVVNVFVRSTLSPNDRFEDRMNLGSVPFAIVTANNGEASKDPGEPNIAGNPGGKSLWWSWTAPASGRVQVSSAGSSFSPLLGIYVGEAISNLTLMVQNETAPIMPNHGPIPHPTTAYTTNLFFDVQAGVTYQIAVDGMSGSGTIRSGAIVLTLELSTLRLSAPVPESRLLVPADVHIGATFDSDVEGILPRIDYYAGANLVASGFQPTYSAVWSTTSPGNYSLRAVATNSSGHLIESLPRTVNIGSATNDDFSSLVRLTGGAATMNGNNLGATREPGEPLLPGSALGETLWWNWTASTNGSVSLLIDTNSNFLPTMGVFTGTTLTDLSLVASNSYQECAATGFRGQICRTRQRQRMTFEAAAGTTYFIAVDGYRHDVCGGQPYDATGEFSIALEFRQILNDNFDRRTLLSGSDITLTNQSFAATREAGEPAQGTNHLARTVWYRWTAPALGRVSVTRDGTPIDFGDDSGSSGVIIIGGNGPPACTVLSESPPANLFVPIYSVYTGVVLSNLTAIGSGERVDFDAFPGMTYAIAVSGPGDSTGEFPLHLELNRPVNDDFAARTVLNGSQIYIEGSNWGATREPDEPQHASATNQFRSVWWTWTAPASGTVRLHAFASQYHELCVRAYVGNSLASLAPVTGLSDSGPVFFYALAGLTYQFAAVGYPSEDEYQGPLILTLIGPPSPPSVDPISSRREVDGTFHLGITGETGQSFVLQRSGDLVHWENVMTDTVLSGTAEFMDHDAEALSHRFYRAVALDSALANLPSLVRQSAVTVSAGLPLDLKSNASNEYLIEASTNLVDWSEISRTRSYEDALSWVDPEPTKFPYRFYRLVRMP